MFSVKCNIRQESGCLRRMQTKVCKHVNVYEEQKMEDTTGFVCKNVR